MKPDSNHCTLPIKGVYYCRSSAANPKWCELLQYGTEAFLYQNRKTFLSQKITAVLHTHLFHVWPSAVWSSNFDCAHWVARLFENRTEKLNTKNKLVLAFLCCELDLLRPILCTTTTMFLFEIFAFSIIEIVGLFQLCGNNAGYLFVF